MSHNNLGRDVTEITPPDESTRHLLKDWREGNDEAATEIWNRFAPDLLDWAKQRLSPALACRSDEDDIMQSVFRTFFRRSRDVGYVHDERGAAWALLLTIARRKLAQQARYHQAQCRDYHREQDNLAAIPAKERSDPGKVELWLLVKEELDDLLDSLTPTQAETARLGLLEGRSIRETADATKQSYDSVRRLLLRVRETLRRRIAPDQENFGIF